MARLGELLLAGIRLAEGQSTGQTPVTVAQRQQAVTSLRMIREAFAEKNRWAPADLRQQLGLTGYQTKRALRQLASDGYLVAAGKTRSAVYSLRSTDAADVRRSS